MCSRRRPSKGNETSSSLLYSLGFNSSNGSRTVRISFSSVSLRSSVIVVATYTFFEFLNAEVYRFTEPLFADIAIPFDGKFVCAFLALHFVFDDELVGR